MIHFHGTPLTPRAKLLELAGRSFCVPFVNPQNLEVCHEIGESVMLDSGAFSAWTRGITLDWQAYMDWCEPWLDFHTTWAVIPDVIGGSEQENDMLLITWFQRRLPRGAPVWHMHESLERFKRLCHGYPTVCVGSSGGFRTPGDARWVRRMDEAFNAICGNGPAPCWLHMLRAMDQVSGGDWPFSSADSTNVARNHAGTNGDRPAVPPRRMADLVDARQAPARWRIREHTMEMLS